MSIDLSSSDLISARRMSFSKISSGLRLIFLCSVVSSSDWDSSFIVESASLSSMSVSCLFLRFDCGLLALGGLRFFALVGVGAPEAFMHSSLKNVFMVVLGVSVVSFELFLLLFFFFCTSLAVVSRVSLRLLLILGSLFMINDSGPFDCRCIKFNTCNITHFLVFCLSFYSLQQFGVNVLVRHVILTHSFNSWV